MVLLVTENKKHKGGLMDCYDTVFGHRLNNNKRSGLPFHAAAKK
jgi:hypothetical protein